MDNGQSDMLAAKWALPAHFLLPAHIFDCCIFNTPLQFWLPITAAVGFEAFRCQIERHSEQNRVVEVRRRELGTQSLPFLQPHMPYLVDP
jgi:hypothetical protein